MSRLEDVATATVGHVTLRATVRVQTDDPMYKVIESMKGQHRGAVLVEDGKDLVGIFTERDVMQRLDHNDLGWLHVNVGEVMTPRPTVIHADDTIAEAMRRMTQGRRRHLPVVDTAGHAMGLLSIRDLLAYVAERFPEEFVNLPPDPEHEASGEWGG
jgi:CBS domain-containing protein